MKEPTLSTKTLHVIHLITHILCLLTFAINKGVENSYHISLLFVILWTRQFRLECMWVLVQQAKAMRGEKGRKCVLKFQ